MRWRPPTRPCQLPLFCHHDEGDGGDDGDDDDDDDDQYETDADDGGGHQPDPAKVPSFEKVMMLIMKKKGTEILSLNQTNWGEGNESISYFIPHTLLNHTLKQSVLLSFTYFTLSSLFGKVAYTNLFPFLLVNIDSQKLAMGCTTSSSQSP